MGRCAGSYAGKCHPRDSAEGLRNLRASDAVHADGALVVNADLHRQRPTIVVGHASQRRLSLPQRHAQLLCQPFSLLRQHITILDVPCLLCTTAPPPPPAPSFKESTRRYQ